MAILINEKTEAIIQGITGSSGKTQAKYMLSMGTKLRAGVTPGRGGMEVEGVPVFDTVAHAKEKFPGIDASLICVPPAFARSSVLEAIDAGLKVLVLHTERIPQHDMLEIVARAQKVGAHVIGSNTIGVLSPKKCLVGTQGRNKEFADKIFLEGPCGVLSRSGGQTTTLSYYLSKQGLGCSTVVASGGDAILGTTWEELLLMFQDDPDTKLVVAYGEIGTSSEEDAARLIRDGKFTKPFIISVAGRYALPEMRFGHAGAIITGNSGTAESKKKILREAGAVVVESLSDVGVTAARILKEMQTDGR